MLIRMTGHCPSGRSTGYAVMTSFPFLSRTLLVAVYKFVDLIRQLHPFLRNYLSSLAIAADKLRGFVRSP